MISGNGENNGNGNSFAVKRAARRLDELFDAQGASILHLCRLILRDPIEAEDAAQQTFLSAYRALLRGTAPREPDAWVAQIARNECRARLRRRKLAAVPLEVDAEDARDTVDVAAGHEQLQAVAAAIEELPTRQRQAVVLSDLRGFSNDEVARAMSLAPGTVEALLYRGRLRVRRAFRRSWPATVVVPVWLRDALVRLATQLETSLSAAPAARVVAGVAVAVVAAGAATIEIEHQQAKPRAPRVHTVTRDASVSTRRHGAMSEMVSVRRTPVQAESHSHSAGDARSGRRVHTREQDGGGRGPSRPHTATPVSSTSGPGPSGSTPPTAVGASSGPGPAPTTQPVSDNSGPGSHESPSGEPLTQPDSSGPSVERSSSGPSLASSSSGSDGSNSGPGSLTSGSDSSTTGSDSSGSDSASSGSASPGSDSSGSNPSGSGPAGSDSSGSDSSGSDSSGPSSDGHSGPGG